MSTTTNSTTASYLHSDEGWQTFDEVQSGEAPKSEYRPFQEVVEEQATPDVAAEDTVAEVAADEAPAERKADVPAAPKAQSDIDKLAEILQAALLKNAQPAAQQAAPSAAQRQEDQFAEPTFSFDEKQAEAEIRAEMEAELHAQQIEEEEFETETVRGEDGEDILVLKRDENGRKILKPLNAREKHQFDQAVKATLAQRKAEAARAHEDAVAEVRYKRHYHEVSTDYARGLVYDALPGARVGENKIDGKTFANVGPYVRSMIHAVIDTQLERSPGKSMQQVFGGRDITDTIEKATEYGAGVVKFIFDEIRKGAAPAGEKQEQKQPDAKAAEAPKAATTYAGVMAKVNADKKVAATPSAPQNATTVAAKPQVSAMSIVSKMMQGGNAAAQEIQRVARGEVSVRFAKSVSPGTTTTTTKG